MIQLTLPEKDGVSALPEKSEKHNNAYFIALRYDVKISSQLTSHSSARLKPSRASYSISISAGALSLQCWLYAHLVVVNLSTNPALTPLYPLPACLGNIGNMNFWWGNISCRRLVKVKTFQVDLTWEKNRHLWVLLAVLAATRPLQWSSWKTTPAHFVRRNDRFILIWASFRKHNREFIRTYPLDF